MERQNSLLFRTFDRYKPHIGSSDGFADSFCISSIMFFGFDELGSYQCDGMAQPLQFIGPEVGRGTGFHADKAGWDIDKKEAICERLSYLLNNRVPCSFPL
jgi:hypothetical protein